MPTKKILLIDDEIPIRDFLKDFFEDRGYVVETAQDGLEGFEKYQKNTFDLVLCDMLMPRMIGLEVLRKIKELNKDQRVMMMTGVKEKSMMDKAVALGCRYYLTKPVQLTELETKVDACFSA